MLAEYEDIKKRIKEEPKWYDKNGVPRYDHFHPDLSPNIYATEVILMEISCQNCGHRFFVEMNWSVVDKAFRDINSLHERIEDNSVHYGDPPRACCACGATMNCVDLEIIQFWSMDLEYKRDKKYEVKLKKTKK